MSGGPFIKRPLRAKLKTPSLAREAASKIWLRNLQGLGNQNCAAGTLHFSSNSLAGQSASNYIGAQNALSGRQQ